MPLIVDVFSQEELGSRLKSAREAVKVTQALAAEQIGVARTTLVAIEKGQRPAKIAELQKLAMLYGTTVNRLLSTNAASLDWLPRFRKDIASDALDTENAVNALSYLARVEFELETTLGVRHFCNYPREKSILPGNIRHQGELDAEEVRHQFGLGYGPINNIISFLENQLGVRVYIRDLGSKISGLYGYDKQVGACILLNANHPETRRNLSAAHELAHLITSRYETEVTLADKAESSREEKYANAFAKAFLTPHYMVKQKFNEITAGASHLSRRYVILLAHYFNVSREALVRRLEELELVKQGVWEWFERNGGISKSMVEDVLGGEVQDASITSYCRHPLPDRIIFLANEVWIRGLLTEGQLADLLQLGRLDLRLILKADWLKEGVVSEATALF